jgi:hypothetical protein
MNTSNVSRLHPEMTAARELDIVLKGLPQGFQSFISDIKSRAEQNITRPDVMKSYIGFLREQVGLVLT